MRGKPAHRPCSNLDVRSSVSVAHFFAAVDDIIDKEGLPLTVVVHCAGVALHRSLEDTDDERFDDVIATNLGGTFRICRQSIPRLRRAGGGRLFTIGSVADRQILPNNAAYGPSKFGVRALTGTINLEHAHEQIRATLVSPGAVATPIWGSSPAFATDDMLRPHDIAAAILAVIQMPLRVRVDAIEVLPERGVL